MQKLLDKLCPEGIEFKHLSELCVSLPKCILKTTELVEGGKYPVVNSGREYYGYYSDYNNEGDAICIASRGNAGYITYMKDKFWAGGLCYPYRSKNKKIISTKFIYYYLKFKENEIMTTLVSKGGVPALNKADVDQVLVAVPPLPVQTEIVSILDKFTTLEAELEAELEARKKQYEYYRDLLLTFNTRERVK